MNVTTATYGRGVTLWDVLAKTVSDSESPARVTAPLVPVRSWTLML